MALKRVLEPPCITSLTLGQSTAARTICRKPALHAIT